MRDIQTQISLAYTLLLGRSIDKAEVEDILNEFRERSKQQQNSSHKRSSLGTERERETSNENHRRSNIEQEKRDTGNNHFSIEECKNVPPTTSATSECSRHLPN